MRILGISICLGCLLAISTSALAQIVVRGSSSASSVSGTVITHIGAGASRTRDTCGSINPTVPGGNAGDLLVALVNAREASATVTMTGWNQAYTDIFPGQDFQVFIFWRLATGGDPNTVTQSGTCSSIGAQIARFRGVDPAQPIETAPIPAGNVVRQNSGNVDTQSQTTTFNLSMLLVASFVDDNRNVTEGNGWSQSFDTDLNVNRPMGLALHYQLLLTPATTSVTNWDLSGGGNDNNYGIIFALRPAPSQLTVNVPAGTALRDVMLASITVRPCSNTSGAACTLNVTAPAGWTLVRAVDQTTGGGLGGLGNRLLVYQRVATAAEPASYTWSFSGPPGNAGAAGAIASFQGVDVTNPIAAEDGGATPSALAHAAPGITTGTVLNTMLVATFTTNASATWTPPGTMTELEDLASLAVPNTAGVSLSMASELRAAAGAAGPRTATQSGAAATGAAHLLALRPAPVHFEIISGNFAVRCAAFPIPVTIIARDGDGNVLSNYANAVSITTSPATGNWSVGVANGKFDNGAANDGAATYEFTTADGGMIRLNLAVTIATTLTITVQEDASGYYSTGLIPITFVTEGYTIVTDPIQVAGRAQGLIVEHRVAPNCGLSTANGHNANNTVRIWLTTDPAHPATATLPGATGTGTSIVNPLPVAEPGASNITLDFSPAAPLVSGQAALTLNTTEVGKYIINIRDGNTAIRGTSAPITTRPFGLALRGANSTTAIQHRNSPTDTILAAAGTDFTATVAAYRWVLADDSDNNGVPGPGIVDITNNGLTARFAWDTKISAGAFLPDTGVAGSFTLGGAAPTVLQASYAGGAATVANLRYGEVGNVVINATAFNYLNSPGVNVTGSSALDGDANGGYTGRFKPDHFFLAAGSTLTNRLAASCGVKTPSSFSYMDEGIGLAFTLQARNGEATPAVTKNYVSGTGAYAKLDPGTITQLGLGALDTTAPTNLTGRLDLSAGSTGSFVAGQAAITATVAVGRRSSPDDPDGPYPGTKIGIAAQEPVSGGDGVVMRTADMNMNVDNAGGNDHVQVGASTQIRFGRLRMQNALGSEKVPLPTLIETQYWAGASTGFVTNTNDSCTKIPRSAIVLDAYTGALAPGGGNCKTFVQQTDVTFSAGAGRLSLAAPLVPGRLTLTPNLGSLAGGNYCDNATSGEATAAAAAMRYLSGRWNASTSTEIPDIAGTNYDDNPSATAAFGLYGSQPKNFIFLRENF